ncbi:unnamed protein product [Amoebophrya sp. A25]|nr:unnamed protein product [Amoebophrya sp. A25]|eukprot:GSA25T00014297001.1
MRRVLCSGSVAARNARRRLPTSHIGAASSCTQTRTWPGGLLRGLNEVVVAIPRASAGALSSTTSSRSAFLQTIVTRARMQSTKTRGGGEDPNARHDKELPTAPSSFYRQMCARGEIQQDAMQEAAIKRLSQLFHECEENFAPSFGDERFHPSAYDAGAGLNSNMGRKISSGRPGPTSAAGPPLTKHTFARTKSGSRDIMDPSLLVNSKKMINDSTSSPFAAFGKRYRRRTRTRGGGPPMVGLYLHGSAGSGKTMCMDIFFRSLKTAGIKAKREHFHEFLYTVHRTLHKLKQADKQLSSNEAMNQFARMLKAEADVLCFDELAITTIQDCTILAPLFAKLFREGVVLVTTSNRAPESLYEDGLNRHLYIPAFLKVLNEHMDIATVQSTDYRRDQYENAAQRTKIFFHCSEKGKMVAFLRSIFSMGEAATGGTASTDEGAIENASGLSPRSPSSTSAAGSPAAAKPLSRGSSVGGSRGFVSVAREIKPKAADSIVSDTTALINENAAGKETSNEGEDRQGSVVNETATSSSQNDHDFPPMTMASRPGGRHVFDSVLLDLFPHGHFVEVGYNRNYPCRHCRPDGTAALFSFAELFKGPPFLGADDYNALCTQFPTIVLDGLPRLEVSDHNEAKRLTNFLDCAYEHHVRLICVNMEAETVEGIFAELLPLETLDVAEVIRENKEGSVGSGDQDATAASSGVLSAVRAVSDAVGKNQQSCYFLSADHNNWSVESKIVTTSTSTSTASSIADSLTTKSSHSFSGASKTAAPDSGDSEQQFFSAPPLSQRQTREQLETEKDVEIWRQDKHGLPQVSRQWDDRRRVSQAEWEASDPTAEQHTVKGVFVAAIASLHETGFAVRRAVSRLQEMQTRTYLKEWEQEQERRLPIKGKDATS